MDRHGKHDDLLAAIATILEAADTRRIGGTIDETSKLHGRVTLQAGCEISTAISGSRRSSRADDRARRIHRPVLVDRTGLPHHAERDRR